MASNLEYEEVEAGFHTREEPEENSDEPIHTGHWSTFGTYWCDTCDSPYCDLA